MTALAPGVPNTLQAPRCESAREHRLDISLLHFEKLSATSVSEWDALSARILQCLFHCGRPVVGTGLLSTRQDDRVPSSELFGRAIICMTSPAFPISRSQDGSQIRNQRWPILQNTKHRCDRITQQAKRNRLVDPLV